MEIYSNYNALKLGGRMLFIASAWLPASFIGL